MANVSCAYFLALIALGCPLAAQGKTINLFCQDEDEAIQVALTIDEEAKTVVEHASFGKYTTPSLRNYRDGDRVATSNWGPGVQLVSIGNEYIIYGIRYDADPNGYPGAISKLDRRTGDVQFGALGHLSCEVVHPREELPRKF